MSNSDITWLWSGCCRRERIYMHMQGHVVSFCTNTQTHICTRVKPCDCTIINDPPPPSHPAILSWKNHYAVPLLLKSNTLTFSLDLMAWVYCTALRPPLPATPIHSSNTHTHTHTHTHRQSTLLWFHNCASVMYFIWSHFSVLKWTSCKVYVLCSSHLVYRQVDMHYVNGLHRLHGQASLKVCPLGSCPLGSCPL